MDAERDAGPLSGLASHELRITQGGKIRAWVEFALKFFEACILGQCIKFQTNTRCQDNEERALILHTLPVAAKGKSKENRRNEVAASGDNEPQEAPLLPHGTDATKKETRSGLAVSTATIPRLITVVEIIKREYLAAMNAKKSPHLVGLFQYNEMGSLEDQVENEEGEEEESAGDRMKTIAEALAGSKK